MIWHSFRRSQRERERPSIPFVLIVIVVCVCVRPNCKTRIQHIVPEAVQIEYTIHRMHATHSPHTHSALETEPKEDIPLLFVPLLLPCLLLLLLAPHLDRNMFCMCQSEPPFFSRKIQTYFRFYYDGMAKEFLNEKDDNVRNESEVLII